MDATSPRPKPTGVAVAEFLLYTLALTQVGAALLDTAVHRQWRVVADLIAFFGYAALAIQCGAGGRLVRPAVRLLSLLYVVPVFALLSGTVIGAAGADVPRWYAGGSAAVTASGFVFLLEAWILLERPAPSSFFGPGPTAWPPARELPLSRQASYGKRTRTRPRTTGRGSNPRQSTAQSQENPPGIAWSGRDPAPVRP